MSKAKKTDSLAPLPVPEHPAVCTAVLRQACAEQLGRKRSELKQARADLAGYETSARLTAQSIGDATDRIAMLEAEVAELEAFAGADA